MVDGRSRAAGAIEIGSGSSWCSCFFMSPSRQLASFCTYMYVAKILHFFPSPFTRLPSPSPHHDHAAWTPQSALKPAGHHVRASGHGALPPGQPGARDGARRAAGEVAEGGEVRDVRAGADAQDLSAGAAEEAAGEGCVVWFCWGDGVGTSLCGRWVAIVAIIWVHASMLVHYNRMHVSVKPLSSIQLRLPFLMYPLFTHTPR